MISWIVALFLGLYLWIKGYNKQYRLFSHMSCFNKKFLWELIRVGFPIGMTYVIEVGVFLLIAILMGRFSSDELAAHQIALQYWNMVFAVLMAVSQVAAVRSSHAVGANNRKTVKLTIYINTSIGLIIIGFVGLLFFLFPHQTLSWDISQHIQHYHSVVHYSIIFIGISIGMLVFDNIRLTFMCGLRSLKNTKFPLKISAFAFLILIPLMAYWLGFRLNLNGPGLWLALASGPTFCAIMMVWKFAKEVKSADLEALVTKS